MIHDPCPIDQALKVLNELVEADAEAMGALCESRVPCNKSLAGHPTAQVLRDGQEAYAGGLLGILNGIFGIADATVYGPIVAIYEVNCMDPNCARGDIEGGIVGQPCPHCGQPLDLGPLKSFERYSPEKE